MNTVIKGICITQLPQGTDAIRRFFEGEDYRYLQKLGELANVNIIVGQNIKPIDLLLKEARAKGYTVYIFPENGLHYKQKRELAKNILEESKTVKGIFVRTHDYEFISDFNDWINPENTSYLEEGYRLFVHRVKKDETQEV